MICNKKLHAEQHSISFKDTIETSTQSDYINQCLYYATPKCPNFKLLKPKQQLTPFSQKYISMNSELFLPKIAEAKNTGLFSNGRIKLSLKRLAKKRNNSSFYVKLNTEEARDTPKDLKKQPVSESPLLRKHNSGIYFNQLISVSPINHFYKLELKLESKTPQIKFSRIPTYRKLSHSRKKPKSNDHIQKKFQVLDFLTPQTKQIKIKL